MPQRAASAPPSGSARGPRVAPTTPARATALSPRWPASQPGGAPRWLCRPRSPRSPRSPPAALVALPAVRAHARPTQWLAIVLAPPREMPRARRALPASSSTWGCPFRCCRWCSTRLPSPSATRRRSARRHPAAALPRRRRRAIDQGRRPGNHRRSVAGIALRSAVARESGGVRQRGKSRTQCGTPCAARQRQRSAARRRPAYSAGPRRSEASARCAVRAHLWRTGGRRPAQATPAFSTPGRENPAPSAEGARGQHVRAGEGARQHKHKHAARTRRGGGGGGRGARPTRAGRRGLPCINSAPIPRGAPSLPPPPMPPCSPRPTFLPPRRARRGAALRAAPFPAPLAAPACAHRRRARPARRAASSQLRGARPRPSMRSGLPPPAIPTGDPALTRAPRALKETAALRKRSARARTSRRHAAAAAAPRPTA